MIIRKVVQSDREKLVTLLNNVPSFTDDERDVALELLDIYLNKKDQTDYYFIITDDDGAIGSFLCYGPTPMTQGTYDLYWIATHQKHLKKGLAKALVHEMQKLLRVEKGRLIRIETSSQDSYEGTLAFYHHMNFLEEARIKNFYKHNDDLIIFTCKL